MTSLVIFITAIIATALSSMSGGGASIINLPILLWLGIPFPLAVATQKVSSAFWVLPASYNYLRGRKVDWTFLILFSLIGLIGAYIGALVVINTRARILETIIGALIIAFVAYTYFKKDLGLQEKSTYSKTRQKLVYVFAPFLGFYESIFGSGNGVALAIITFYTKGFDFVDALGYYFSISFVWVLFAALFFIAHGYWSISVMFPAIVGGIVGAWFGSRYAKYKGNKFIKMVFVLVGGFLGLKLLFGF